MRLVYKYDQPTSVLSGRNGSMKQISKDGEVFNYELTSPFWKKRRIKNESAAIRADWIGQTCKLLNRSYPMMAAKLYGYPTSWIQEMLETAKSFTKNPQALWWKRYNQSRK